MNAESLGIVKKSYKCAFSTKEGLAKKQDLFDVPRISVTDVALEEFAASIEGTNAVFTNFYKMFRF